PLYVVFLLAPTVTLPFPTVRRLYEMVALVLSVASVWFWMRAFGHRPSVLSIAVASALFLGSYPVVQSFYLQQPALVVAAFIAGAFAAIAAGMFSLGGLVLTLAMIKPQ